MPRFFFHVCNGTGFVEDEEGRELPDLGAARAEALKGARSIMADDLHRGVLDLASFIEVEDERRTLIFTLNFGDLVEIRNQRGAAGS
jgi:hypothetical protein